MSVLRGLTIDNGGSELRYMPETAEHKLGSIETLSNEFYEIPEKEFREKDVHDRTALIRFKRAPKSEYLGIMAQGLTGRAYKGTRIFLSSQEDKTGSLSYYRQFLFAVARDALKKVLDELEDFMNQPAQGLFRKSEPTHIPTEYTYVITTCIPIREFSGSKNCAEILKTALAGNYAVEFPLIPNCPTVKFTIDPACLGVTPEGGVVILSVRKEINPEDYTLMVDMGHNTADISLYKGTTPVGTVKSPNYAGTMLIGMLRAALEDEGYRLTDEQTIQVLETNTVKRGTNTVDVSNIIKTCKQSLVENFLKPEILQLLTTNGIDTKSIQNRLFVGAPMSDRGTGSIPALITKACQLENTNLLHLETGTRYANLGAAALFTTRMLKKAKELNFV